MGAKLQVARGQSRFRSSLRNWDDRVLGGALSPFKCCSLTHSLVVAQLPKLKPLMQAPKRPPLFQVLGPWWLHDMEEALT